MIVFKDGSMYGTSNYLMSKSCVVKPFIYSFLYFTYDVFDTELIIHPRNSIRYYGELVAYVGELIYQVSSLHTIVRVGKDTDLGEILSLVLHNSTFMESAKSHDITIDVDDVKFTITRWG